MSDAAKALAEEGAGAMRDSSLPSCGIQHHGKCPYNDCGMLMDSIDEGVMEVITSFHLPDVLNLDTVSRFIAQSC